MRNKLKFGGMERRVALLCLVLVGGFFALFMRLPDRIAAMEKQRKYEGEFYQFSQLFSEVYGELKDRYVEDIDSKKLFEGAIRGMFASLDDPHSQWLSPDSLSQLEKETEGEFSGVGLNITLRQNVLTVIAPIPGTPAARAGIQAWDRIVEIDGKSTENITLLEAVKKLTGATGSHVKVKVFREGAKDYMEFTLTRDIIKVDSVFYNVREDEIGYIRITRFAESTADEVKKALTEFHENPKLKGVVVDLRWDTGGLLDKAIEICGFFLPEGQLIVSTKGRKEDNNREFFSRSQPLTDLPLAVLVNRGSASASEIFAGAMQDTKRGVIVGPKGDNTFGKGSVQTISYLKHSMERDENGQPKTSGLRLTTALYYTPSGRTIHKVGIKPDVEAAVSREHEAYLIKHGKLLGDPDQSALPDEEDEVVGQDGKKRELTAEEKAEREKKKAEREAEEKKMGEDFHDIQLDEAIKYLRMNLIDGKKTAKN